MSKRGLALLPTPPKGRMADEGPVPFFQISATKRKYCEDMLRKTNKKRLVSATFPQNVTHWKFEQAPGSSRPEQAKRSSGNGVHVPEPRVACSACTTNAGLAPVRQKH